MSVYLFFIHRLHRFHTARERATSTNSRSEQQQKPANAGDSIKPGAQAPGTRTQISAEPANAGDSLMTRCRPFHGLTCFLFRDPGARAPGFMRSPASRAFAGSDFRQSSTNKKARRFLPSAAPTIPTGGKGYSTLESIEDLKLGGNVRCRTKGRRTKVFIISKQRLKNVRRMLFQGICAWVC